MGCFNDSKLIEETTKAKDMWDSAKSIEKWGFKEDLPTFKRVFEAATEKELLSGMAITSTDMKKFQVAIKHLDARLRKPGGAISNKMLKSLYVGAAKVWRTPITERFFNEMIKANEFRNSHTVEMMADYRSVISSLKEAIMVGEGIDTSSMQSGSFSYMDAANPKNFMRKKIANKRFEKLNKLELAFYKKNTEGSMGKTGEEWGHLKEFLDNEGAIFEDFIDLVQSGSKEGLKRKYEGKNAGNYIIAVGKAAKSWQKIEKQSKKHLVSSIDNMVSIVTEKYGHTNTGERLAKEYKEIKAQLEKFEEGYIPHFILDLFGDSIELSEQISRAKTPQGVESIMQKAVGQISEINTSLISRLKKGGLERSEYFSRNPLLYIDKYVSQVAQFNHRSHIDKYFIKGVKDLTKVVLKEPNSKEAKTAEMYLKILTDLHGDATGNNKLDNSPTAKNITRMLTSLQFVSKLGFSPRSAVRNGTQRFLNYVWFGAKMQADAVMAYQGNKSYKDAANKELHEHGLEFIDISKITEGAVTAADMTAMGIDYKKGTGELTYSNEQTFLEKSVKWTAKAAEKSAVFTQIAENWNRRSTFRLAFHARVKQLKISERFSDVELSKDLEGEMYKSAGNYASKIVSLLHFEYSKFGKADILKTGPGAVLGQFSHYAFSFAQLQTRMLRDYKNAFQAGDRTGPELQRIIRMGMLHGLTALVSGMTNIDFSSYVTNDTYDRGAELVKLVTGDDEAFYGKGLVGASGMVPLNDAVEIINLGAAAGYWDLLADPESTAGYLMGMREYDKIDGGEFTKELIGMVSVEGERFINKTLPARKSESPAWSMIRAEFGLYPGTTIFGIKTRDLQKKMLNATGIPTEQRLPGGTKKNAPVDKRRKSSSDFRLKKSNTIRKKVKRIRTGKRDISLNQSERDNAIKSLSNLA